MDTKRMPTHRKGAERKKKRKKARTILWTPSEDNCRLTGRERRKKKRKEELGRSSGHQAKQPERSSGRQRNPVVTLTDQHAR